MYLDNPRPSTKKLTNQVIDERLSNTDFTRIGDYINANTKMLFRCSQGHDVMMKYGNIYSGGSCPECVRKSRCLPIDEIRERLATKDIEIVGEYIDTKNKVTLRCSMGHIWTANKVSGKTGCRVCYGTDKLNEDKVNSRLRDKGITVIGEYDNTHTRTLFRCDDGHEWWAELGTVLRRSGCPGCSIKGFKQTQSAHIYILDFGDFIKYGITNTLRSRLYQHRSTNGNFTIVETRRYECGADALSWENKVKNTLGGRFVTKECCPDGYTETLSKEMLTELMKIR
jgi:hypothetical protein